ncbi:MAG: adenine nucleotide alpha hydrolase [Thermoplasmata archaeon]|nr:adenine nucleotide alpha hydrolase [Thermoplasmata archaeon]
MTSRPRVVVAWSTGKDGAWALHQVRQGGEVEVVGLLTTITRPFDRVSMHGVRTELLEAQGRALGLEVFPVPIPHPCPNEVYERAMEEALGRLRSRGVSSVVFGDLFLTDVREYRERQMASTGLTPLFPLWGRPTPELAREMIDGGLDATVVCLDPRQVPARLAGRRFDRSFLAELPEGVDPCGERGEFHTCVTGGPMFSRAIEVRPGEVVEREGFVFADLALARREP